MTARIWTGIRARAEYLRCLSVVFAVEVRLKIVTEAYMREMSPKQFHEEFGGGSLSRVAQNFERLAETGWLRHIRSEPPGGKRRGRPEHFYRATELAFCDQETWAMLPYSIRVAFSWNAFKQIAQRLREAMEASTFDARPDRHLTSTRLLLDQRGWERVIDAASAEFASQFDEQEDARRRVSRSGEELIRASSVLMAFESPAKGSGQSGPILVQNHNEPLVPFPVRLSKVFADEVCMQIIAEANLREISAPSFYATYRRRSRGRRAGRPSSGLSSRSKRRWRRGPLTPARTEFWLGRSLPSISRAGRKLPPLWMPYLSSSSKSRSWPRPA
jgi:hypothetical protein